MQIIGLTGSVGMGKSTAAGFFRQAGVGVHDSDACVHELYRDQAIGPIEAAFPGTTSDKGVDRILLGQLVMRDAAARSRLEAIVHPLVTAHRQSFLQSQRRSGALLCVIDIPLLFETGADAQADLIAVVSTSAQAQRQRVLARPGMSAERFEQILRAQLPDAEKRRRAHMIIHTDDFAYARRQIHDLLRACHAMRL